MHDPTKEKAVLLTVCGISTLKIPAKTQYTIKYKPGKSMSTADSISRLPLQTTLNDSQVPLPGHLCHLLNHLDEAIVTASQI